MGELPGGGGPWGPPPAYLSDALPDCFTLRRPSLASEEGLVARLLFPLPRHQCSLNSILLTLAGRAVAEARPKWSCDICSRGPFSPPAGRGEGCFPSVAGSTACSPSGTSCSSASVVFLVKCAKLAPADTVSTPHRVCFPLSLRRSHPPPSSPQHPCGLMPIVG